MVHKLLIAGPDFSGLNPPIFLEIGWDREIDDPVGPDNDVAILKCAHAADMVLCAWGRHGALYERGRLVTGMLVSHSLGFKLHYLACNNDGSPSHPLYQRLDLKPQAWGELADEYGRIVH